MCKTKMAVDAIQPSPSTSSSPSRNRNRNRNKKQSNSLSSSSSYSPQPSTTTNTATTTTSSRHSLSSLRGSLPENAHLYDISEIRRATNNFLSKNFTASSSSSSSSSRCWRCTLHGKDVIIFQRKSYNLHDLRPHIIRQKLSSICKSHHVAIVNLLGASISGEHLYLVYDFVNGGNLYDLLHNQNNSEFTVLSSWMSRMQIATDLASGLNYIHNDAGLDGRFVHNHIKSSSVIVTEPSLNAKICHFGTAELCGEPIEEREIDHDHQFEGISSIEEEEVNDENKESSSRKKLTKSNSVKFNGTTGYMSPEFQMTGMGTRKSDVYAFGVVLVELLSGEELVKYKYNKTSKEYTKISALDTARVVVEEGGVEKEGRLRRWVDKRLKDSYPVEVAEKVARLAVDCLHVDPNKRPDMRRVAGKLSKLYLDSQVWCDKMKIPTEITVSFAPR